MTQPTEFSQESVRQFMLNAGGRVTNHDLVKTFRRWLTDPQEKEAARAKFKDYVNTLATIKQENGEKYLILKKKFYPEYQDVRAGYQKLGQPSYREGPLPYGDPNHSNYPSSVRPSQPSHGYGSYQPEPPSYGGSGSPSMLDEIMAGFTPPSRTMGRQLPAIPTSPQASLSHNSIGLPTGPHSIGLPAPAEFGRQLSNSSIGRQESHQYQRQDSESRQFPYQPLNQTRKPEQSYRQLPPEPSYNQSRLPEAAYKQQEPSYNSSGQQDHSYNRPKQQPEPSYNQSRQLTDPAYNQSRQLPDPAYNPSSYNPHVNHNRASVSSLASGTSWPGSQGSYHGSPRGSYSAGSPRTNYALPQTSAVSSYAASNSSSPRTSYAASPPFTQAQFNGSPQPRTPESYQSNPSLSRESSHYHASGSRPPPPYRAPPPELLPYRQPPQPPADVCLPPAPPRQFSTPVYPPQDVSPPPPPKRSSPNTSEPPPLPRRPPPLSEPKKSQPPPPSKSHTSKETSPSPPTTSETSPPSPIQHSPTDSGFQTAPEDRHSDSPQPKMSISLSKSYGNLHTGEDKENLVSSRLNSVSLDQLDNEDNVISVKERTKTFNRMASETDVTATNGTKSIIRSVKRRNSRAVDMNSRRGSCRDDESHDSSSITTIDPTVKSWMVHTAKGDYQTAAKMLSEEPKLARHKDFTSGYTGLHWAAKHNNTDMVKLLAGTYQANVNARSHGGYTPLHIAAQSGNQEVFDLLIQAYRADANLRDYAGKKPRQYLIVQETGALGLSLSLSSDTFRQLKDRRKTRVSRGEKKYRTSQVWITQC